MATDIAFAVGVVTLAGSRVPLGARIFILTLAVVDDVGGIVVIAIFYADDVRLAWLALAVLSVLVTLALRRLEVRSMVPYVALGALCWYSMYRCGVEAAIAGVVFGLLTPTRPFHDPSEFGDVAHGLVDRIETSDEVAAEDLARYARETASPLERIEGRLNLWVAFGIVPLFALVNAGVRLESRGLDARVTLGVVAGLVLGKTIGVFGGAWLAVRLGVGRLPASVTWRHMVGLAVTAGIGFTVALYVTGLSFDDAALVSSAKIGILVASAAAGALGFLLLRTVPAPRHEEEAAGRCASRRCHPRRRVALMVQDRYRPRRGRRSGRTRRAVARLAGAGGAAAGAGSGRAAPAARGRGGASAAREPGRARGLGAGTGRRERGHGPSGDAAVAGPARCRTAT